MAKEVDTDLGAVARILMKIKNRRKRVKEEMIGNEVEREVDAAAGVIMKYGEKDERLVLMIQRSANDHWPLHWEFPRGKCDKPIGEEIPFCLVREVKEETGLDVTPVTFLGTHEYIADGGKRKTICHNYLCRVEDPDQKVKLSKEHQNFKWVSEAGQVELMAFPDQMKVLQKVLNPERKIANAPTSKPMDNYSLEGYLEMIQGIKEVT